MVLIEWSEGVDKLSVVTQGILPVGLLVASMVVGQVFTVEVVPEILRLISILVSAECGMHGVVCEISPVC